MRRFVLAILVSVIITIPISTIYAQQIYNIPSWVKGVANFWAEGDISDAEFGEAMTFLIDQRILKVPLIQSLQKQVKQLETKVIQLEGENDLLRSKLAESDTPEKPIDDSIEEQSEFTVKTDSDFYDVGDTIIISGTADPSTTLIPPSKEEPKTLETKQLVTIQIIASNGDVVTIYQAEPNDDGTFSNEVIAEGQMWEAPGLWTVKATQGPENSAQAQFWFIVDGR